MATKFLKSARFDFQLKKIARRSFFMLVFEMTSYIDSY